MIDLVSTQVCAKDLPLQLPEYNYGGMCVRGPLRWKSGDVMITSNELGELEGNHRHIGRNPNRVQALGNWLCKPRGDFRISPMRYAAFKLLILAMVSFSGPVLAFSEELYFPTTDRDWETVTPESLGWDVAALEHVIDLVGTSNGKSFLILKDGKIVAERYWTPAGADHAQYVMSCGKSITAFLIGIAQEQGRLNIEQPVADFLGGGWSRASKVQEQSIHIEHVLKMTSGLNAGRRFETSPDKKWFYNTTVYQDLHPLLEKAVGKTMQEFSNEVLFQPTGMKHSRFRFHSFVMTARDMGRFGLLILAEGEWNGQQIIKDKSYFNEMIDSSQELNPSYGYLWWLNGKASQVSVGRRGTVKNGPLIPTAPPDLICANGKGGQHIYIVPSQSLVVVRLGDAPERAEQGVQAESAGGSSANFNTHLWEKLMLAVHPQRPKTP